MIIELLNGTRFDIENYSLKRLFHYIPSASINHNSVEVDGRSDIIVNSKINNRIINVEFIYQAQDIFDYYAIRDQVNALFLRDESYYIIFKNEPHKRWLVRCASEFTLTPNMRMESFNVEFITLNTYAESVSTTKTLKEWDVDSWSWDSSIDWDNDLNYTFRTSSFQVNNLGNAKIDPRNSYLKISVIFTSTEGYFQLTNRTTGDVYRYNPYLNALNRLTIDGIRTLRDGRSDFANTNKKLITLNPGINDFLVEGGIVNTVDFDFRFLYK